jgi:murein DD-endopeptidase MepM/ murein hydrolase activator NlpD
MPINKAGQYMARRVFVTSLLLFALFSMPLTLCGAEQEYHVIQTGETLYSIAKSYSIPYEMLASINGITDPSKIRPGIVLLIPQVHVVAKSETYYGIAKKYDISIQELKSANSLSDSYILRVGDVLLIPEKGGGASQTAQLAPQPSSSPVASVNNVPPAAAAPVGSKPTTAPTEPSSPSSTPTPSAPSASSTPSTSVSSSAPNTKTEASASHSPDALVSWPVDGKGQYMSGKLEGIMFQTNRGAPVRAVASGTVVSAGPSRGFGEVVFIQSKSGFVYVYGGNESILVKTGENIEPGKTIAKVGLDTKEGNPIAYFFVFRNGQPVDPSLAPRE